MQALNCLGDNTKTYFEFSHQYGARQDKLTQDLSYYKQNHESHHKAEHISSHL